MGLLLARKCGLTLLKLFLLENLKDRRLHAFEVNHVNRFSGAWWEFHAFFPQQLIVPHDARVVRFVHHERIIPQLNEVEDAIFDLKEGVSQPLLKKISLCSLLLPSSSLSS